MRKSLFLAALIVLGSTAYGAVDARMLRQPDVSQNQITFVYAGDIWTVPKTGGTAHRLSSPRGEESLPRFSPDGSSIAFSGNYDGNEDIYTIPATGGPVRRVTHHPHSDRMVDWHPNGDSLLFASGMQSGRQRFRQFYQTAASGGLPQKLPVPYGEFGAISPDGKMLAYMPKSRDGRSWKRYRGGWAPEIWLFDLERRTAENVTNNPANDGHPMWHGRTLYFLSDRGPEQRFNIWAYELDSKQTRQVTQIDRYDIHYPAIGPEEIVFEAAGRLYLLDLSNEVHREVKIDVVTDQASVRPRAVKVARQINDAAISPSGKRALMEARGEIFSVPAEHGVIRNLTASSGVAERYPAWSPDGRHIVYWSDRPGEYELMLRSADGSADEKQVTSLGAGFRYRPHWSPDSKKVAFVDQALRVHVLDVDSGQSKQIDKAVRMSHGGLNNFNFSWSGDSRWLAYSRDLETLSTAIFLYDTGNEQLNQVTSGYYSDANPAFDPDGKYLFFLTNRTFTPIYSDVDNTWVYPNTTGIAAVPLRKDVASPLEPRNDEEKMEDEKKEDKPKEEEKKTESAAEGETSKKEEKKAVEIDLEGFEWRVVLLPPEAGNYNSLNAVSGKVLYRRLPRSGSSSQVKNALVYYDLKEREEQVVLEDINGYRLSADGKKILAASNGSFAIVDLKPKQKIEKRLRTAELEMTVDPRAEWRQIFTDAWRFERDYFYDPYMHGVDWDEMKTRYGQLIEDAVTRWDVNFVLGELIGELNASHTYRGGGDNEEAAERGVGLLGVDWKLENGAYRIARIVRGAPWDDVRSPLDRPGLDVKEGEYVLAVNGVPLETGKDPWASFQGLAGETISLTINDSPRMEGARQVIVETLESEDRLRHLDWIEQNRRRVDEASGGTVGYIYVRSTGLDGQRELVRQFSAQFTKDGLIIDERFNSGGQIPDRFIELLNRPALSYWATRDGKELPFPPVSHIGPKVMLINGWSGSGGDAFPYYFREASLGPLIGTRTWGGLIGISGAPPLVDGGGVTVPTFRMYSTSGKWFEEGYGVEPDIEVIDDPAALSKGVDPQLEKAIEEVMRRIKESPPVHPKRPKYEDRTKVLP